MAFMLSKGHGDLRILEGGKVVECDAKSYSGNTAVTKPLVDGATWTVTLEKFGNSSSIYCGVMHKDQTKWWSLCSDAYGLYMHGNSKPGLPGTNWKIQAEIGEVWHFRYGGGELRIKRVLKSGKLVHDEQVAFADLPSGLCAFVDVNIKGDRVRVEGSQGSAKQARGKKKASASGPRTLYVPAMYPDLAAAVLNATDGDTIDLAMGKFPGGVTVKSSITIKGTASTVIDGAITQGESTTLRLVDLHIKGSDAFKLGKNCQLEAQGVVFEASSNSFYAGGSAGGSSAMLNHCEFIGTPGKKAGWGLFVYGTGGGIKINMDGCTVSNCSSGITINLDNVVTISNSQFSDNNTAIDVSATAKAIVSKCAFTDNKSVFKSSSKSKCNFADCSFGSGQESIPTSGKYAAVKGSSDKVADSHVAAGSEDPADSGSGALPQQLVMSSPHKDVHCNGNTLFVPDSSTHGGYTCIGSAAVTGKLTFSVTKTAGKSAFRIGLRQSQKQPQDLFQKYLSDLKSDPVQSFSSTSVLVDTPVRVSIDVNAGKIVWEWNDQTGSDKVVTKEIPKKPHWVLMSVAHEVRIVIKSGQVSGNDAAEPATSEGVVWTKVKPPANAKSYVGKIAQDVPAGDVVGLRVRITNAGSTYSTITNSTNIEWPANPTWKERGSKSGWASYYPKNDHEGLVVHCWKTGGSGPEKSWTTVNVALLEVWHWPDGRVVEGAPFYVPIGCKGLTVIGAADTPATPALVKKKAEESKQAEEAKASKPEAPKISSATEAALAAARDGTVQKPFGHCRLCLVGQGRAGKTSTLKSLNGEPYDAACQSTVGIASDALVCELTQDETTQWKRRDDDLGAAERALLAEIQSRMKSQGLDVSNPADAMAMAALLESMGKGTRAAQMREAQLDKATASLLEVQPTMSDPKAGRRKQRGGVFGTLGRGRKQRASMKVVSPPQESQPEPPPGSRKASQAQAEEQPAAQEQANDGDGDGDGDGAGTNSQEVAAAPEIDLGVLEDCIGRMDKDFVSRNLDKVAGQDDRMPLIFDTWDYAGQKVFYSLFHLFLTPLGVYVVVFNMNKLQKNFREGRPKVEDATSGLIEDDAIGYLDFWLESVDEHAFGARVFLVGTHKDMISSKQDQEELSQMLVKRYRHKATIMSAIVPNEREGLLFFPINNQLSDKDPTVELLRNAIEETANGLEFTRTEVPLSWLNLMDAMNQLAKKKKDDKSESALFTELRGKYDHDGTGVQRLTLDEAWRVAQGCKVKSQKSFRSALDFCHEVGVVLHFNQKDVEDVVFLKPQYLIDRITCIIRDFQLHSIVTAGGIGGSSPLISLLSEHAILSENLLPYLWSKNSEAERKQLIKLMVMFDLAVPYTGFSDGQELQYLVPALLQDKKMKPRAPEGDLYIAFGKETEPVSGGLTFDCLSSECFLPYGLFSCLTAQVVEHCQRTKGGAAELSNGAVRIAFGCHEFEIQSVPHRNSIRVLCFVKNGLPVVDRVQRCLVRLLSQRFPRLKFHIMLPVSEERLIELSTLHEEYTANKSVVLVGSEDRSIPEKFKMKELQSMHQCWLPRLNIEQVAHIMISYRQAADGEFARVLWDCLTLESVGDGDQPVVFYDQMFLSQGERFDKAFMLAIARSLVCTPIVSTAAVESMKTLSPKAGADRLDNVLLEWMLCTHLENVGVVKHVLPIFIGEPANDEPQSFFRSFKAEDFPDEVSDITHDKFAQFVETDLKLKAPRRRTTRQVLQDVTAYQGIKTWTTQSAYDPRLRTSSQAPLVSSSELCKQVTAVMAKHTNSMQQAVERGGTLRRAKTKKQTPIVQQDAAPIANGKPMNQWSESEVLEWLAQEGFHKVIPVFEEEEISGGMLANLTAELLRDDMGVKKIMARTLISARDKALDG